MKEEQNREQLGALPYVISGLSFIPVLGILFGVFVITWGLVTKKIGGKKLALIGASGIALSILVLVGIFYFNINYEKNVLADLRAKDIEVNRQADELGGSKIEKIDKLLEITHISKVDPMMIEQIKQYKRDSSTAIYQDIEKRYPDIIASKKKEVDERFNQFWSNLYSSVNTMSTMYDYLRRMYIENYDENEIDQLIAHYSSELGVKDAQRKKVAAMEFNRVYSNELKFKVETELDSLFKDIEKLK